MSLTTGKHKDIIDSDKDFFFGDETFFTIGQFWKWAFSDLLLNTIRGVLAEFIVGKILGAKMDYAKNDWDPNDIVLEDGTTIEVKSSAYIQTWKQKTLSKINFGGLKSKNAIDTLKEEDDYNSQYYIFCVFNAKNDEDYKPFDLSLWEFRILPRHTLVKLGIKSISLESLKKQSPKSFSARTLKAGFDEVRAANVL
jgi:hypothetical protein